MDFRVFYTKRSLDDLAAIVERIAIDDASSASRFSVALLDHIDLLASFPRMGSPLPAQPRVRKLVHSPVVAYYRILATRKTVEIIHLRHGARLEPLRL
ncbi:MAG: type II toxin-antitoxin system RelE/ParE family toxin [Acidobacteria bacterium]|nr:type II toxin-antitoxin system RelE/ParE family toxin [Acidobacteriota bacterium]